jgi:hypothetical protein
VYVSTPRPAAPTEAIHPTPLSFRYVLKWDEHYNPARDEAHRHAQFSAARKSLEAELGDQVAVAVQ